MAERASILRLLIAEERKLIRDKSSLEVMLKNIQTLRNKLKVEQIQLSTMIRSEMAEDALAVDRRENNIIVPDQTQPEQETDVEFNPSNQPVLDLEVNFTSRNPFFKEQEEEEHDEEGDDEEDEDDNVVCAMDVLGSQTEHDVDFEDF